MSENVFLSYAPQDKDFVDAVRPKLAGLLSTRNTPFEVFDAMEHVRPGEDVRGALKKAINVASTVVVFSSPAADASEWVNYEAGMADALGKRIVIIGRKDRQSENTRLRNRLADRNFIKVDYAG
ncbi:MAG TPA: hypothetical protein DDZ76_09745 [Xanthomonadales bacterium]|nr:hypothetical protein [Xanthomonadales bacterium]